MTEKRHYFAHFFFKGGACLGTKLVASYQVIILLWPRSLIKLTTNDVTELPIADAHLLVSTGHQWQLHSVSANMPCSYSLATINNVKGVFTPENK